MINPTNVTYAPAMQKLANNRREMRRISSADQIDADVKKLGAGAYNLLLPETRALHSLIKPQERIEGIVYGKYAHQGRSETGRGALVATNQRIMLVDKKPLFVKCDEVSFKAVSGVTYSRVGLIGIVTLHSRLGDIKVRTYNQKCARSFVRSIEATLFESKSKDDWL